MFPQYCSLPLCSPASSQSLLPAQTCYSSSCASYGSPGLLSLQDYSQDDPWLTPLSSHGRDCSHHPSSLWGVRSHVTDTFVNHLKPNKNIQYKMLINNSFVFSRRRSAVIDIAVSSSVCCLFFYTNFWVRAKLVQLRCHKVHVLTLKESPRKAPNRDVS